MEMTYLGSAIVHHLIARLLLESLEENLVRHIAPVLTASAQNLLEVLCSSSIVRSISHKVLFFLSTTPFWGAYTNLKTGVPDPSHDKRF
jgi:hypothetical protein